MIPLSSIAMSATIAPKVEIYTQLACAQHRLEVYNHTPPIPLSPPLVDLNTSYVAYDHNEAFPGVIEASRKEPSDRCKTDPVVQAAVARLAAVMLTGMGILSCLTTGWWSSFSDRHGRTAALGISVIGLLFTDANFILVYYFSRSLPGGYWFLLLGPLLEGSMGGFTTAVAVTHAYFADTTTLATRSRIFSMNLGIIFAGVAVGPTLGGLLNRVTRQTISVFYAASLIHLIYAFMIWFIVPESNSKRKMQLAKAKYQEELTESRRTGEVAGVISRLRVERLFSFLSPLAVFNPSRAQVSGNPLKPPRRDWNLTLVALGYAFTISIMGSVTSIFQYAQITFGWSSETLAYWLSLVGAARAFHLAIILPLCIKFFKRKPVPVTSGETEPLLSSASSASPSTSTTSSRIVRPPGAGARSDSPSRLTEPHSIEFDLGLARASLALEFVAYTMMALVPNPVAFTCFAMLGSAGAGFSPAIQSVALEMFTQRGGTETGRLFGALSVIQALSSQIIGPALYGLVYMKTVATLPRTIFFVSVGSLFVSLVCLSLVRLPRSKGVADEDGHMREDTLVDTAFEEEGVIRQDRGRKPVSSIGFSG
jgi:MFS family permease